LPCLRIGLSRRSAGYRAECVICVVDNVDAYNAANEIQWADSEIAEATKTAVTVGTIYERPKYDPVVTRVDHEDGSITLTERWSSMWTLRSEAI